jgi:CHASE2 domain-containing sensor protein
MKKLFYLVAYTAIGAASSVHALQGNWQPAIWTLFVLTCTQNAIAQFDKE